MVNSSKKYSAFYPIFFSIKTYMNNSPIVCFLHFLSSVISAGKIYLFAFLNKLLINELVIQITNENIKMAMLSLFVIIVLVFFNEFLFSLINDIFRYYMTKYSMKYHDKMQTAFLSKLSAIDIEFFDSPKQQDLLMQTRKDMDSIETIYKGVVNLIVALTSTVISTIIISRLNIILTIAIFLSLLPSFFVKKKIQKVNYEQEKELNNIDRRVGYLSGLFGNRDIAQEMRLFSFSKKILADLQTIYHFRNDKKLRLQRKNTILSLFSLIISGVLNISYNLYIIYIVIVNRLTVGDYNYYSTIAGNFKSNVEIILNNCSSIIINSERVLNYMNFMDLQPKIIGGEVEVPLHKNTIEFVDVTFIYPNTDRRVLDHLSFEIIDGEKIAFAGLNGAGKTTIIKLLLRFYDPTDGKILLVR